MSGVLDNSFRRTLNNDADVIGIDSVNTSHTLGGIVEWQLEQKRILLESGIHDILNWNSIINQKVKHADLHWLARRVISMIIVINFNMGV